MTARHGNGLEYTSFQEQGFRISTSSPSISLHSIQGTSIRGFKGRLTAPSSAPKRLLKAKGWQKELNFLRHLCAPLPSEIGSR
ncbi:hypothetical protein E6O75_ATG05758 [Venturia nashicola]|uniref:Uncharacterized protein n=1 Tax=Venturia nashicola TaxID=86259 RepID=A0A4Z1NY18_9PEZI|nr:hypothetical protein E6O75_ATG05758 [Venturia nashicola]